MKRIGVVIGAVLFFGGVNTASCDVFTTFDSEVKDNKARSVLLLSEKENKIDEESFWEKLTDTSDGKNIIGDEDDKILYAPPPGEDGNPQKITPLNNCDVIVFLLLSCMAYVWYGRRLKMTE